MFVDDDEEAPLLDENESASEPHRVPTDLIKRTTMAGPRRTNGCNAASLLVRFDEYWPFASTVVAYYYIKNGSRISHEAHLVTSSVERWLQHDFDLKPDPGVHEVCAQIIRQPELRHQVCRVIVDRLECPFPEQNRVPPLHFSLFYISFAFFISR
ncbi:unnamed protein product [Nippostrongylus brasiliensis]|uniref:Uncharacterized protein n=1 Tax=Nippostrongylus brasiliensis TaxID=27835 RepID=A0A158R1J3_NIPBR|nr:unnamed protein product [Nippostrongylus brasiliensis]